MKSLDERISELDLRDMELRAGYEYGPVSGEKTRVDYDPIAIVDRKSFDQLLNIARRYEKALEKCKWVRNNYIAMAQNSRTDIGPNTAELMTDTQAAKDNEELAAIFDAVESEGM